MATKNWYIGRMLVTRHEKGSKYHGYWFSWENRWIHFMIGRWEVSITY